MLPQNAVARRSLDVALGILGDLRVCQIAESSLLGDLVHNSEHRF